MAYASLGQAASAEARNFIGGSIAPAIQEKEIPGQMSRLGSAISGISTRLEELESKLMPILEKRPNTLPQVQASPMPARLTDVGDCMQGFIDRLNTAIENLDSITERLGI